MFVGGVRWTEILTKNDESVPSFFVSISVQPARTDKRMMPIDCLEIPLGGPKKSTLFYANIFYTKLFYAKKLFYATIFFYHKNIFLRQKHFYAKIFLHFLA